MLLVVSCNNLRGLLAKRLHCQPSSHFDIAGYFEVDVHRIGDPRDNSISMVIILLSEVIWRHEVVEGKLSLVSFSLLGSELVRKKKLS